MRIWVVIDRSLKRFFGVPTITPAHERGFFVQVVAVGLQDVPPRLRRGVVVALPACDLDRMPLKASGPTGGVVPRLRLVAYVGSRAGDPIRVNPSDSLLIGVSSRPWRFAGLRSRSQATAMTTQMRVQKPYALLTTHPASRSHRHEKCCGGWQFGGFFLPLANCGKQI